MALFLTLLGVVTGPSAAPSRSLTAPVTPRGTNPIEISLCTATSAPSETGTADYYVVLKAQYQNYGRQTIAPIIIRFDFLDESREVVASHTVIDSTGLPPHYGNNGQWQSVGYPTNAKFLRCTPVLRN